MIVVSDVVDLQRRMAAFLDGWLGELYLDTQASVLHGYSRHRFSAFLRESLRFGKAFYCAPTACKYLSAHVASAASWILAQPGVPAAGFCCLAEPLPLPGPPLGYSNDANVEMAALFWSFDDGQSATKRAPAGPPALFVGMFPPSARRGSLPWLGAPLLAFAWPLGATCSAALLAHDRWRLEQPAADYDYALRLMAAFFAGLATGALNQQIVTAGAAASAISREVRLIVPL